MIKHKSCTPDQGRKLCTVATTGAVKVVGIALCLIILMVITSCSPSSTDYTAPTAGVFPAELFQSLPEPLSTSGESPDKAAASLATEVLASNENSLPALVAAFQASGIAVRGADDTLVVEPSSPWQGMIYEAWELRMLTNLVSDKSAISFSLTDLSKGLTGAIPELQGAPVAQMFIDDIRAQARGNNPPKQFFALFIVELGRQAKDHESYDLMSNVDPAKLQLDGIQTSLIIRRLATDLLILAGPRQTNMNLQPVEWPHFQIFAEPAYAEGNLPCTLDSKERNIMDLTAMGIKWGLGGVKVFDYGWEGLYNYLGRNGVAGADAFKKGTGYASLAATYAKLVYTYVALTVETTIDKQPLVRTKSLRPAVGERGTLSAKVTMNVGNAQMFNCFRIMLNSVGVDFSVPNDGPLKGAHVSWEGLDGFNEAATALHGGPEQIVRFVGQPGSRIQTGGDPSSGLNAVTNQVVGGDGMVRVDVEGVGQPKELSDEAQKVTKHASVNVQVAVKGADIFKDLKDAAQSAPGGVKTLLTLPAELLKRMKWFAAGQYTFEVQDWDEQVGDTWSGTITLNEQGGSSSSDPFGTSRSTFNSLVTVHVLRGRATSTGQSNSTKHGDYTFDNEIGSTVSSQDETVTMSGENNTGTPVNVQLNSDGSYKIFVDEGGRLTGQSETNGHSTATCKIPSKACVGGTNEMNRSAPANGSYGISRTLEGTTSPDNPKVLSGSITEKAQNGDETVTISWNLTRDAP